MTNFPTTGRLGELSVPSIGERVDELVRVRNVVIEEIASSATPDPTTQRQEHDEWVAVLAGEADLEIDGEMQRLVAGDWVLLPARSPHRVVRTVPGTRWLAVHIHPSGS